MNIALLKAVFILPGTVLVFVPALLTWISEKTSYAAKATSFTQLSFWIGVAAAILGLILMIWTVTLFKTLGGGGTPAPWEPVKKLVIRGPYRYVRNPIILGAFLGLLAESLLLQSLPIGAWLLFFVVGNAIYIRLREEKELEKRFGQEYIEYKKHVPRWFPRTTPWTGTH